MTPRQAKTEEQRAGILEAAATLIAARGFHGMSMRDLAEATHFGVSSLYNYFASKEELLAELQIRAFRTLIDQVTAALPADADAATRLYVFIHNQVRYFIEHTDVMRVLVHEAAALPPVHRHAVRGLKEAYFRLGRDVVADVFAQGCGPGGSQPPQRRGQVDGVELDRATYSLFGMINWVWAWYDPKQHGSADDIARSIHSLAMCGLVSGCPATPGAGTVQAWTSQPQVSLLRERTGTEG